MSSIVLANFIKGANIYHSNIILIISMRLREKINIKNDTRVC